HDRFVANLDAQGAEEHDRIHRLSGRACQAVTSATTASVTVELDSSLVVELETLLRWSEPALMPGRMKGGTMKLTIHRRASRAAVCSSLVLVICCAAAAAQDPA